MCENEINYHQKQKGNKILVGSLSFSRLISSIVIFSHSSNNAALIPLTVVILSDARRRRILLFRISQMRSIGLKSGEFDTRSSLGMPCFSLSWLVYYALWHGAPSSIKTNSGLCCNFRKHSGHINGAATCFTYRHAPTPRACSPRLIFSTLNFFPLQDCSIFFFSPPLFSAAR